MKLPWLTEGQKFAIGASIVFLGFCGFFALAPQSAYGADFAVTHPYIPTQPMPQPANPMPVAPLRFMVHKGQLIVEYPGKRCPDGQAGCHRETEKAIYYLDEEAKQHELEHVDGMRHGDWLQGGGMKCAKVTISGETHWRVGEWICRAPSGIYVSGGT